MRRFSVHVGTHKTGTSSIQNVLAVNERVFRAAGILVPATGRPELPGHPGHHNIAWELNEDPRFRREAGTLTALISEVAQMAPDVAVVSSEDFEYLHAKPDVLRTLARAVADIGYKLDFVVFLRPQAEYAQSLYLTLLLFGLDLHFSEFLEVVLRRGAFTFSDRWVFQFDYARLLAPLIDVAGSNNVSVRRHRQDSADSYLLEEFVAIVQARTAKIPLELLNLPGRLNRQMSLEAARERLRENQGDASLRDLREAKSFDSLWKAGDRARILSRFGSSNAAISARFGLELPAIGSVPGNEPDSYPASFIQ